MKYRAVMLGVFAGFLLVGLVLVNNHVLAQDAAVSNWKIAVVDRKTVFSEYKKQQDEMAKLEAELKTMQDELDAMSEKIQTAKDTYLEKRDNMSETERDAEKSRIQQEFVAYEAELKSRQAKMDAKTAALIKEVKKDIDLAIAQYGDDNDYHLILEGDADPKSRTSVLYYHSRIDITLEIQRILNEAYAKAQ
ncbi:MAG: OmpH family outer membrane protein, partial [Candidatus Hydrogenedentes bacterium]|nr:OmpH family outer membrane protein [Candidatus Hydrogenedentota bacterium]